MINTGLSDDELLDKARLALRKKDSERAKSFFAQYAQRRLANARENVANDLQ